ncbi:MAG TPA: helix-turn-helix domain-containing protein [Candidatus Saccharimonadales bacterium]|nr:helix-turn-helix domain-containing protein [Candidatus Saccharimonadales bacterium]
MRSVQSKSAPQGEGLTPPRLLIPVGDAKHLLGDISTATLYRLFQRGELPSVHVAGRRFVRAADLSRYVAELAE